MSGEAVTALKIHDDIKPLAWLLGKWRSTKALCIYPTMNDFQYREDLEFLHVGQPNIQFSFYSYNAETGAPMHREMGFIRIKPGTNHIAFIGSHNNGVTDMEEGEVTGTEFTVQSVNIGRMSFGKSPAVKSMRRTFRLIENRLEQVLDMETENTPLAEHLRASYERVNA